MPGVGVGVTVTVGVAVRSGRGVLVGIRVGVEVEVGVRGGKYGKAGGGVQNWIPGLGIDQRGQHRRGGFLRPLLAKEQAALNCQGDHQSEHQ